MRLAYKELADEEERRRDPNKWRDTEVFEINQLFNRCDTQTRTRDRTHTHTWWC